MVTQVTNHGKKMGNDMTNDSLAAQFRDDMREIRDELKDIRSDVQDCSQRLTTIEVEFKSYRKNNGNGNGNNSKTVELNLKNIAIAVVTALGIGGGGSVLSTALQTEPAQVEHHAPPPWVSDLMKSLKND